MIRAKATSSGYEADARPLAAQIRDPTRRAHLCTKWCERVRRRTGGLTHTSAMLSIAKLAVGTEAYYLAAIAEGLDDYYTGEGEAPGRWFGRGAAVLGLDGAVEPLDLQAVMAGLRPGTGLTPNGEILRAHPTQKRTTHRTKKLVNAFDRRLPSP